MFSCRSIGHFTPRSSSLSNASAALDDTSLRKIAPSKRLGKVFCMGIGACLFEGFALDLLPLEGDGETVEGSSRLSLRRFPLPLLLPLLLLHGRHTRMFSIRFHIFVLMQRFWPCTMPCVFNANISQVSYLLTHTNCPQLYRFLLLHPCGFL